MPDSETEQGHHDGATQGALPRSVRIGVPLASILILLVFAVTIMLPSNKSTLPVQSTLFFVPVYLVVVVGVVFGSMYIFKSLIDKDTTTTQHH
jgi:heme/copper-type cytochrome/quinol oxidase subunit 4